MLIPSKGQKNYRYIYIYIFLAQFFHRWIVSVIFRYNIIIDRKKKHVGTKKETNKKMNDILLLYLNQKEMK